MSTSPITAYQVVLPRPWIQIPVRGGTRERVRQIVEFMAREAPKEMPPDQLGPMKREIEERLVRDVTSSRDYGGLHHYIPLGTMHGFHLGASFVVSEVSPPVPPEVELDEQTVAATLAGLVADDGELIEIGGDPWVRTEEVVAPDQAKAADVDVPTRRVHYYAPVPDDPTTWILVAFSCVGDGTPDGDLTTLSVELFDAIMSTWRWGRRDPTTSEDR